MTTTQHPCRRGPLDGLASRRPDRSVLLLGALALPLCLGGCPSPDAQGKYDRFNEQTEDERNQPEPKLDFGGPELPDTDTEEAMYPDVSGTFLVAIDTSVNPGLPLQFLAEVTADLDAMGNGPFSVEFQPLSLNQGSTTEPREEVGETIIIESEATGGSFVLDFGETMVTGAANPITGSDIVSVITLEGSVRNMDAFCGIATGDVLSPIMVPLAGSVFGAMRLADRSERPGEGMFPVSCETVESLGIGADDEEGSSTGG